MTHNQVSVLDTRPTKLFYMKDYKAYLVKSRNKVTSGMMYLMPLFVLFIVIEKFWYKISHLGKIIVHNFKLDAFLGKYSLTITTGLLLLLIFYVFGYLATLNGFKKFYNWLEGMLLGVIPGYSTYKAQLENKINPVPDSRVSVVVKTPLGDKPGLLVEEQSNQSIVFFPNTTDATSGDVMIVENTAIKKINLDAKTLLNIMKKQGKGLPIT